MYSFGEEMVIEGDITAIWQANRRGRLAEHADPVVMFSFLADQALAPASRGTEGFGSGPSLRRSLRRTGRRVFRGDVDDAL